MKKLIIKPLCALAIVFVVLLSCNRSETGKVGPKARFTEALDFYSSISLENGMLVFPDMKTVADFLDQLDADVDAHVDAFVEEWGHLPEEEFEAKIEELNFNEDQPFVDMEDHFSFASLREKIVADEEEWLETTSGDNIEEDPDNHFVIEENDRAILSERCEIKIGSTIYIMNPSGNGETFAITDGSLTTLNTFRNGGDITNEPNVTVLNPNNDAIRVDCRSGETDRGYWPINPTTHKIKWVVGHKTPIWKPRHVIAKTKNYKKKSNGKWDKYSTLCKARVFGHISDLPGDCSTQKQFNTNTQNAPIAEKNAGTVKHSISVQTKTASGWVQGYHYGAGGITHISTLTW